MSRCTVRWRREWGQLCGRISIWVTHPNAGMITYVYIEWMRSHLLWWWQLAKMQGVADVQFVLPLSIYCVSLWLIQKLLAKRMTDENPWWLRWDRCHNISQMYISSLMTCSWGWGGLVQPPGSCAGCWEIGVWSLDTSQSFVILLIAAFWHSEGEQDAHSLVFGKVV